MVAQYMPQPFKHPKTQVYYYRRVVPHHLRDALGRTEFRISLRTKDLREAKLRYPETAAEVEAKLAQAAGGPAHLTHRQIVALAGRWYRRKLDEYDANPADPLGWEVWADELREAYHEDRIAPAIRPQVDELLKAEGLVLDARSREGLDEAVLVNAIQLTDKLIARSQGDYSLDPFLQTIPEWRGLKDLADQAEAVPVSTLFEAWAAERRFAPKTRYSWDRIITKLTTRLGHADAAKITDTDIIAWKDALVGSGLRPKTIENHLTVTKTFFRWALKNKRIASNPAADVEYRAKHDPVTARQSYSDDRGRTHQGHDRSSAVRLGRRAAPRAASLCRPFHHGICP